MADRADIHELYEESVQNVENEVHFLSTTFRELAGREAHTLREDFCGTASLACEWVKQGVDYSAIGVDIDASVLDWGRNNRVARLPSEDQARVRLIESDVQTVETPKVDILAAFNFSYWIFEERQQMVAYMRRCYEALADDGICADLTKSEEIIRAFYNISDGLPQIIYLVGVQTGGHDGTYPTLAGGTNPNVGTEEQLRALFKACKEIIIPGLI